MAAVEEKDYYELLGVSRTAKTDEIRKAYLKLAHLYHPDKTGGDKKAEEKLKKINEAYDTLKNPEKRKQYDLLLRGSPFQGFESGGFNASDFQASGGGFGFDDIFSSLFGGAAGRAHRPPRQQPGEDIEVILTITLQEAAAGTTKKIRIPRREACATCQGSGAAPGSQPQTCPACRGTGTVQRSMGAAFSMTQTCTRCGGKGTLISKPCPRCHGAGWQQTSRDLSVHVPAGVAADARLRLAKEGEPGALGGPRGDLYVRIALAQDSFFVREGDDLICDVPVPFPVAALGGKIRVPTLTGSADLSIPEGTQNGAQLRMRGLGMPNEHGARTGDQIVRIAVEVPTQLSHQQQDLVRQMSSDGANYPKYRRFLERIRNASGQ